MFVHERIVIKGIPTLAANPDGVTLFCNGASSTSFADFTALRTNLSLCHTVNPKSLRSDLT
jgi:hypothetical protein